MFGSANILTTLRFHLGFQKMLRQSLLACQTEHNFWNDVVASIEKSVENANSEKAMGKPVVTLLSIPIVSQLVDNPSDQRDRC